MQSGTLSYSNGDIFLFVSDILHIKAHTQNSASVPALSLELDFQTPVLVL